MEWPTFFALLFLTPLGWVGLAIAVGGIVALVSAIIGLSRD